MSAHLSEYVCVKCGPVTDHEITWHGGDDLRHETPSRDLCGPVRWVDPKSPPFTGTRESLHARISDVLRRSGVEDAEQLIRSLEIDRAEVVKCLGEGLYYTSLLAETKPNATMGAMALSAAERIDRALSGREIGPPKPASERAE